MVAYTPSEDTRYAFAVGRVRSREAKMLTRQQLERLAESRDENQIISSLADTPYGEVRAEDLETMLSGAAVEEEVFFRRYLEEEKIRDFFTAPVLVSNLKFALRRYYGGELDDRLFQTGGWPSAEGSPSIEEFARLLEGESTTIPEWLSQAAGEVVAANLEALDPAIIDIVLDRALIKHQYEAAKGYSFLEALLTHQVDLANLLTFLRLKLAEEPWDEFESSFLPYGSVGGDRFKTWWELAKESWPNQITQVDTYKGLSDGLREVPNSFILLERQMKEVQLEFLLSTRRLAFGYEPLVGYVFLKREERLNIKRVAVGLRSGEERDKIRSAIAWFD